MIGCGGSARQIASVPSTGLWPAAHPAPDSSSSTQFVTLNPTYNAISAVVSNVNSSYHGLTVAVTKRANNWLSDDANYTWSHALDFNQNQSTSVSTNSWFDPYANARANYANSYLDVRHRAVGWVSFLW